MNPCIAIIDKNTLSCIALRNILWEIYNKVEVLTYGSIDEFIRDSNRHFIHFFVSSEILFFHVDEFETMKKQTTVVSSGPARKFESAGFNVLDVAAPEAELLGRVLKIQIISSYTERDDNSLMRRSQKGKELSPREKDVLRLMIQGRLNKEIAAILGISLTTAIFHRNNICDKLETRSIGKLTIYAVLAGIIDINEI